MSVPYRNHDACQQGHDGKSLCNNSSSHHFLRKKVNSDLFPIWIATWLPSLSFLPNLNRPFTRKKVVAPQPKEYPRHFLQLWSEFSFAFMIPPIGRKGFSLNFLTSFSEGASWCFFPVSLFTASSLFNCKVMEGSEEKALALEVPVSTQIHPLQCSLCFWRASYPAVFCTLPLFLQPWQLPSSVRGCL